jgi:hypothetical protein
MLQEMVEEWDQCEKKLKATQSWIQQSRHTLEDSVQKERPLRDQVRTVLFSQEVLPTISTLSALLNCTFIAPFVKRYF